MKFASTVIVLSSLVAAASAQVSLFARNDCSWKGHCVGAVCKDYNDCADPYACVAGICSESGSTPAVSAASTSGDELCEDAEPTVAAASTPAAGDELCDDAEASPSATAAKPTAAALSLAAKPATNASDELCDDETGAASTPAAAAASADDELCDDDASGIAASPTAAAQSSDDELCDESDASAAASSSPTVTEAPATSTYTTKKEKKNKKGKETTEAAAAASASPTSDATTSSYATSTSAASSGSGNGGGTKQGSMHFTFYGYADNTNAAGNGYGSDAIANPGLGPKKHQVVSEATGAYDDPSSAAADTSIYKPGTILYVPQVKKYFIIEDSCTDCKGDKSHIDLYMGPNSLSGGKVMCCEDITDGGDTVYINAKAGYEVNTASLYTEECAAKGLKSVPDCKTVNNGGVYKRSHSIQSSLSTGRYR